MITGMACMF